MTEAKQPAAAELSTLAKEELLCWYLCSERLMVLTYLTKYNFKPTDVHCSKITL